MAVPDEIRSAIVSLWARPRPYPDNAFDAPEFLTLKEVCGRHYDIGSPFWFTMSLWEILRSLGCPLALRHTRGKPLDAETAAIGLHAALTSKVAKIVHLCPLDWADRPPPVSFGNNSLRQFSADELRALFDAPRLARIFPNVTPDWDRFAEFYWLVVQETHPITVEPGQRTHPFMYEMSRDYGAITAHEARFPQAVEDALVMLLSAPWEDWSEAPEVDWRGFRIPWVYSSNNDLCVSAKSPPLESSLTWTPEIRTGWNGEPVEVEEPAHFRLADEASGLPAFVNDDAWRSLTMARTTPLFETPVCHFFVRGYHASDIDEFMVHLVVCDAALGLQSDFGSKSRGDPRQGKTATKILAHRIAKLLHDESSGREFESLFQLRSAYIHGRQMAPISSDNRVRARRLARKIVVALVEAAQTVAGGPSTSVREDWLLRLSQP